MGKTQGRVGRRGNDSNGPILQEEAIHPGPEVGFSRGLAFISGLFTIGYGLKPSSLIGINFSWESFGPQLMPLAGARQIATTANHPSGGPSFFGLQKIRHQTHPKEKKMMKWFPVHAAESSCC